MTSRAPAEGRAAVHSAPPEDLSAALKPAAIVDIPQIIEADVAFLALHGGLGEDGRLAGTRGHSATIEVF